MEVNYDYLRTMNKIIFDRYIEEALKEEDDLYPHHLTLPPPNEITVAPYFGMV
jgi:dynein heavy chain